MKNSYTTIYYKDQKISGIFAATLENDFYDEVLLGATEIIEEKIPKRDIPYFYGVSRSPLEFEVTFAFSKPLDIYEIKKYTEMFYNNETYQTLAFEREDGFMTPIYYVLAIGDLSSEYMRTETNKYIGYFKIQFRCNAPYGFEEGEFSNYYNYKTKITERNSLGFDTYPENIGDVLQIKIGGNIIVYKGTTSVGELSWPLYSWDDFSINFSTGLMTVPPGSAYLGLEVELVYPKEDSLSLNLTNASMPSSYYLIELKNFDSKQTVELVNLTADQSFVFNNIAKDESIFIDGRNKRIFSDNKTQTSIYERWTNDPKSFIELINNINNFTLTQGVYLKITYKLPRFI